MTVTLTKPTATAADWNATHPVGMPVVYWPGVLTGTGRVSKTRTPAWVVGGYVAVVSVDGYPGGIALTHVKPITGWGVQFGGCPFPGHVDVRENEADAVRYLGALHFCGNTDAHLVVNTGADWCPVETVVTP